MNHGRGEYCFGLLGAVAISRWPEILTINIINYSRYHSTLELPIILPLLSPAQTHGSAVIIAQQANRGWESRYLVRSWACCP